MELSVLAERRAYWQLVLELVVEPNINNMQIILVINPHGWATCKQGNIIIPCANKLHGKACESVYKMLSNPACGVRKIPTSYSDEYTDFNLEIARK